VAAAVFSGNFCAQGSTCRRRGRGQDSRSATVAKENPA